MENRINEGTPNSLQDAMQVDPANPRLAAHLGRQFADRALHYRSVSLYDAKVAQAEADFQTRRALKLAPENEEVKRLRAEVVKLLQLTSE